MIARFRRAARGVARGARWALRFLRVAVLRDFDPAEIAAIKRSLHYDPLRPLSWLDRLEQANAQRALPKLGGPRRPR